VSATTLNKMSRELTKNTTPCVKCGTVYPWEGTRAQIAEMLRTTCGLCPSCSAGRKVPPSVGEQPDWMRGRAPISPTATPAGLPHRRRRGREGRP
jgi:hypothetical protein